jgi:hypothetical protein
MRDSLISDLNNFFSLTQMMNLNDLFEMATVTHLYSKLSFKKLFTINY